VIQKPPRFAPAHAEAFQDAAVVDAYRYRPPYPLNIFEVLTELLSGESRRVLDAGCGTGNLARRLIDYADQVDAVDFSHPMIEQGKRLPNGDHPGLRWLHGRIEDVALEPPYALVTAGESLHWMDWHIILPRFHKLLTAGGYLAIVTRETVPDPWSILGEIVSRYRTDGGYAPYNMIEQLERHDLFRKVGEKKSVPAPFEQSIDDFIESYHSRSGFSRERMGPVRATAFDEEARKILRGTYGYGVIPFQVEGSVVWGLPRGGCTGPDCGTDSRRPRSKRRSAC
jgi:SAM-dependent methyltransferase